VLLAGDTAFVGVGKRGNDIGRNGFAQVARAHGYRVVEVKIDPSVPSLRAVAGTVAKDTIVLAPDRVDRSAFEGFRTIVLERGEGMAAGVIAIGERHVIADIRYRTALRVMRNAGVTVEAIDLYEFGKIGLTPSTLVLALKRD
jgi:N-dimethylarginine dimethylaminohydrolase